MSDPYFANVVTLLHCNGANDSTVFTDVIGKTYTATNQARIRTSQFKFGGASLHLDASANHNSIETPHHADFAFGTGDFTVEFWVRFITTGISAWQIGKTTTTGCS